MKDFLGLQTYFFPHYVRLFPTNLNLCPTFTAFVRIYPVWQLMQIIVKSKEPGWINGIEMIKSERNQMNLSVD